MSQKSANPITSMLQILMGTADLTKEKASDVAESFLHMPGVGPAGQMTDQVAALADALVQLAAANRRLVVDVVRSELEAGLSRFGLATQAELSAAAAETERLTTEVKRLRNALDVAGIEFSDSADSRDYEILGYETQSAARVTPPAARRPRSRATATRTAGVRKAAGKKSASAGSAKKATPASKATPAQRSTPAKKAAATKKAAKRPTEGDR